MKNIFVLLLFLSLFILSIVREPISDSLDAFAGATNNTYGPAVDSIAGASYDDDEDDDDDDDDDDDEHEEDDD
jgi:hypothetical protein